MSKGDTLQVETEQLLRERAWRETWLRLAGVGVVAKRPKPDRAGRPLVVPSAKGTKRPVTAPMIHRRFSPGVVHR